MDSFSGRSTPIAVKPEASGPGRAQLPPPQLPGRKPLPVQIPTPAAQKIARKPTPPAVPPPRRSQTTVDLLGDDDGAEMGGGWEALKPS